MGGIDLAALGFTQEELQARVVDQLCEKLLTGMEYDPDSETECPVASRFQQAIAARVKQHVEETINAIAEAKVLPNVREYIETLSLQATNEWGEKRGESVTFVEYLVQRAQAYMQEKVNFEGKSKAVANGYSWNGTQTRLTHLIHQHLHYSIEHAMKDALTSATAQIAKGIHETARLKLNEIAASMKVAITTK